MNDAGALEIRWTEGDLMSQDAADIVVYSLMEEIMKNDDDGQ